MKGKSNNVFELKAGTLYPLLHSMEERDGLLDEQEAGGKMRKYYRITRDGKKQYQAKKKEWKEYWSYFFTGDRRCVFWNGVIIWN